MTPAEITKELDELEHRLERLRIKYDQYFTGTERALPFVQRKDVDRRFQGLHREQMRNTGIRFRFQTMVQRFTTYQTYWGRIIRQIEEGTWKRDVVRAQRMGLKLPGASDARNNPNEPEELSADQLEDVDEDGESLGASTHASRGNREEIPDSLFGAWRPDPSHGREELPMGTDFDDPEPEVSPVERGPFVTPTLPTVTAPVPEPVVRPRPVLSPFGALRAPSPARGVQPASPSVSIQVTAARAPVNTSTPDASPLPSPSPSPSPSPGRVVPPPPSAVLPPPDATVSARSVTSAESVASTRGGRALPPRGQPPRGTTGPQQAAAGSPRSPEPVPSPAPSPARPSGTGDEPGIRQLYDRYLEARKQTGESTNVQFETVAKQVRETLPRLSEKYQGADVKLDVTIKDGKAILRPVVTVKKK